MGIFDLDNSRENGLVLISGRFIRNEVTGPKSVYFKAEFELSNEDRLFRSFSAILPGHAYIQEQGAKSSCGQKGQAGKAGKQASAEREKA